MIALRSRRRGEEHENPAWPGLVDLFAFAMVVTLVLWVGANKAAKTAEAKLRQQQPAGNGESGAVENEMEELGKIVDQLGVDVETTPRPDLLAVEVKGFRDSPVFFETGSFELPQQQRQTVIALAARVARLMTENADLAVIVNGTADPQNLKQIRPPRNNVELSALRAAGVSQMLLEADLPMCRVQVVGLGAQEGTAERFTAEQLKDMRRVYLLLRRLPKNVRGKYGDCP